MVQKQTSFEVILPLPQSVIRGEVKKDTNRLILGGALRSAPQMVSTLSLARRPARDKRYTFDLRRENRPLQLLDSLKSLPSTQRKAFVYAVDRTFFRSRSRVNPGTPGLLLRRRRGSRKAPRGL